MTALQRLQLRQSEIRERLNALLAIEEPSEEERTELDALTTEGREIEPKIRAAIVAAGDGEGTGEVRTEEDPEARELRSLIEGANAGEVFRAAMDHARPNGATAELQEHYGLPANAVPLVLLERRDVATVPAGAESSTEPTVRPVFATGDAAWLGVRMPTVAVGDAVFPVLTTRPTVGGPHRDDTAVDETTGVFEASSLSPGRLQAAFSYRRTDAARFGDLDASLRAALSDGLSEALDAQLVGQLVSEVGRTDAEAVGTFEIYRKQMIYALLDGRYASEEGDLRLLMGQATAAFMASKYRSNTADDSALDSLRRLAGGVRISAHIPAVAGNKQDVIVRRGMAEDAVVPLWPGVSLIPDEISGAREGRVKLTAVLLAAFKVLREEGFARVQSQHA